MSNAQRTTRFTVCQHPRALRSQGSGDEGDSGEHHQATEVDPASEAEAARSSSGVRITLHDGRQPKVADSLLAIVVVGGLCLPHTAGALKRSGPRAPPDPELTF